LQQLIIASAGLRRHGTDIRSQTKTLDTTTTTPPGGSAFVIEVPRENTAARSREGLARPPASHAGRARSSCLGSTQPSSRHQIIKRSAASAGQQPHKMNARGIGYTIHSVRIAD
jgi:hypothetical protein